MGAGAQVALTLSGHRQDSRVSGLLLEFNFGTVTVVSTGLEKCIATGRKRFGEEGASHASPTHVRIPSLHAATGFTSVHGFCGTRDVGLSCGYSLQQVASPWESCGRDNEEARTHVARSVTAAEQESKTRGTKSTREQECESERARLRNRETRLRDGEIMRWQAGGQDCEGAELRESGAARPHLFAMCFELLGGPAVVIL